MLNQITLNLAEAKRRFSPRVVEVAHKTAVHRTALRGRVAASKAIRARYRVTARQVTRAVSTRLETGTDATTRAVLRYSGARLGLEQFDPREVRVRGKTSTVRRGRKGLATKRQVRRSSRQQKGVSIQILKQGGRKVVTGKQGFGAFMTDLYGLKVFIRRTQRRLPIRRLTTVALPEMVSHHSVQTAFDNRVAETYPAIFEQALNHKLGIT